jgi:FkbM family methyltransferase
MAFEPDPDNFDLLVNNLAATMCGNVTPVPAAASDVLGNVGTQFDYGKTSIIPSGEIPATPIDMIEGLPHIDFVKIDVEGMELKVLNGMRQTIASYKPQMLLEMQDPTTYAKTYDFLNGFGYNIYWLPVRTYTEFNHKNNKEDVFGAQHGVINWICSTIQLNTTLQAVVDRDDTVERMVWRRNQNVGNDTRNGG